MQKRAVFIWLFRLVVNLSGTKHRKKNMAQHGQLIHTSTWLTHSGEPVDV